MGHFIVEGISTWAKSPMKIHGRFYLSKKTPDYKMTHQLFTLFWIISNILTFHFFTFSVIYTFYFYIAFAQLIFYQKCSIKCVLYSLFYQKSNWSHLLGARLKVHSSHICEIIVWATGYQPSWCPLLHIPSYLALFARFLSFKNN